MLASLIPGVTFPQKSSSILLAKIIASSLGGAIAMVCSK